MTDQLVRSLETLPALEELELDRTSGYTEESLAAAVSSKTLQRIVFDACTGVGPLLLRQMAQNPSIRSVTFISIPLSGTLLKELSYSQSLRHLVIENAPDISASVIASCFQHSPITQLHVSAVQKGKVSDLLKLTALESLSIGAGTIDQGFVTLLVEHPKLRALSLVGCLVDPKTIAASDAARNRNVKTLKVFGTMLHKLDPEIGVLLDLFESLTVVQFGYVKSVNGALVRRLQGKVVEEVALDWCDTVTKDAMLEMSRLHLKSMSCIGTPIDTAHLVEGFRDLCTLVLSDITLSTDVMKMLSGCDNISSLTIDNCIIDNVVDLHDCLARLSKLIKLHVDCGKISAGDLLPVLTESHVIEDLSLASAPNLTDGDVVALKKLPLRRLSVRGTALTGAALETLSGLSTLEILDLRFCEKVSEIPFELHDSNVAFSGLRAVYLRGADKNGVVARWLRSIRSGLYVAN